MKYITHEADASNALSNIDRDPGHNESYVIPSAIK